MLDIDKWQSQYDMRRSQCIEDFDEIEKLATWYEYFQKSYQSMDIELARRRAFEEDMAKKVEAMRNYLRQEIAKEQQIRLDFNEQHYRYLPQNLKTLLEEYPTRYDIYPKMTSINIEGALEGVSSDFVKQLLGSTSKYNVVPGTNIHILKDSYFTHKPSAMNSKQQVASGTFDDAETFDCCEDDYHQIMLEKAAGETIKTNNSTKTSEEEEKLRGGESNR